MNSFFIFFVLICQCLHSKHRHSFFNSYRFTILNPNPQSESACQAAFVSTGISKSILEFATPSKY